ncbi:MAG: glycosyltransferase family 2 protein [Gammaproteobacteria bacterium]|nr:glycosyltransferase family 2 protein [Gammaproteobacteria bacterium]
MSANYCVVIPTFNHYSYLDTLVSGILRQGLAVFVIDDGSEDPAKTHISSLLEDEKGVTLKRIEINSGKGVAVSEALRLAKQNGFTHAIQIDSDGQYQANQITGLIEASRIHPESVISGFRSYSSMPPNRRYGRMATDVWVWINTLSFTIKDSMCGLRLYPLDQSIKLIEAAKIKPRMEFDTDILVKLYWNGLDIQHVSVIAGYNDCIESRFDLLNDNLRISLMHATHFFGMLRRLPLLLYRKLRKRNG